jgi:dephospho-CoA kinase
MSDYVIGLTGGIACGKSNLSRALRAYGAPVVDADEISRALTAKGGAALPAIRARWGDQVFEGEELNRRALSDVIFADPQERAALNAIVHPMVFAEMRRQMAAERGPVVLDVPLLFEAGMENWCDEIWCAWVPQKEQVRRLRKREGVTYAEALRRIHAQMPNAEKRKRANHVIRTDGTKEQSGQIVISLWRNALSRRQPKGAERL